MKRILLVLCGVVAVVLVVVGLVRWTADDDIPEDLPNVVLIVMCSTRADQTPMYGGAFDTMPSLEARASGALVFEDGVTAAPWTRPAVAAIVTGSHPATWGMLEPLARRSDRVLPREARTMAERLDAVGYETIGRSANPNVSAAFGLDQGFDDFANLSPRWRHGVHKVLGSEVVEALVAAVDTRSDPEAPLFVQAMFVDPHQPTTASRVAGRAYRGPDEPLRLGRYRAMLRSLDAAVDRLLTQLSERGITEDNTVFVVVNDHGDAVWDAAVVDRLGGADDVVGPICQDLASLLERFDGYRGRFSAALARVRAGDGEWFARPMIDSYHTVWFELHENLLATLGIERAKEHAA